MPWRCRQNGESMNFALRTLPNSEQVSCVETRYNHFLLFYCTCHDQSYSSLVSVLYLVHPWWTFEFTKASLFFPKVFTTADNYAQFSFCMWSCFFNDLFSLVSAFVALRFRFVAFLYLLKLLRVRFVSFLYLLILASSFVLRFESYFFAARLTLFSSFRSPAFITHNCTKPALLQTPQLPLRMWEGASHFSMCKAFVSKQLLLPVIAIHAV